MNHLKEPSEDRHPNFWLRLVGLLQMVSKMCWDFLWDLRQLVRQPRLISPTLPFVFPDDADIFTKTSAIATANVASCLEERYLLDGSLKQVLCAGTRNFREPWARDFGFASFGLLAMGEQQAVKECLEAFLFYQKDNGQFPVKIHSTTILERYLHSLFKREQPITKPLRPKYQTAHRTISLDGNCLLVIAAIHYVQETKDYDFLRLHWGSLYLAINWLELHALEDDGLLHQGAFTDWADSIARTGRIFYTNILYWKALLSLAEMSPYCEEESLQQARYNKSDRLLDSIQNHFWNEELGYFVTSQSHQNLSSGGNTMAIAWGAATEVQADRILNTMRLLKMADPVPTQVVSHPYPKQLIALENRLAGIGHYHMDAAWLWLGGWHVVALLKCGRREEAGQLLERIANVVIRDGIVHEVYGKDSNFLATYLYTSEAPLSWNASLIIYALSQYNS